MAGIASLMNCERNGCYLSSEEWVRQNFVQYLVKTKKYPAARIALEKEIQLGELKKRFDILVYDKRFQTMDDDRM